MAAAEHAALAFVLNAAWQTPLVVVAGILLDRATRRAPARIRHQVWSVVLLVAVLAPALGASGVGRALRPVPATPAATKTPAAASGDGGPLATGDGLDGGPGATQDVAGRPDPFHGRASRLGALWNGSDILRAGAERRSPIGLVAILLVTLPALLGCLRLARSVGRARSLWLTAGPPAAGDRAVPLSESTRKALGLGPVALLVTDEPIAPAAIGLVRPAIMLPRSLLREARDAELRAVLAHEMAHVARHDAARHVLAELALLPLRFHPVVPLLRRRLAETRELACDEAAAGVVGGVRDYARALLDVSAILAGLSRPLTLPGVLGAGLLEVRMRHLTGNSTPWGRLRARLSLALATVALVALAVTTIPFAMGGTDAPPAPPAPPDAPALPAAPEGQPAPTAPAPPVSRAPRVAPAPPTPVAPETPTSPPAPPGTPAPPAPASAPTPSVAPAPPEPPGTPVKATVDLDVTIAVRSATAGREVDVEGVYVFAPEGSRLHYVKQRTPFEIKTTARLLDGIFSATGEDASIRIEMRSEGGRHSHATATATGNTVTLHTTDASNGWRIATL